MNRGYRKLTNSTALKTPFKVGAPSKRQGSNGDQIVADVHGEIRFYRKELNRWFYTVLNDNTPASAKISQGIASQVSLGVIKVGSGLSITNTGVLSTTGPGANNYLDGITKSSNTLTFSVSGTDNQDFTFGSNAFTSYAAPHYTSAITLSELQTTIGTGNSKLVPAIGSSGQFLQYNGTWATPPDTTYSVGDGGLTQNNFTNALKTKLDSIDSGTTSAQILIYAEDDTAYNALVMSGDVTMDKDGVTTVANDSHTHSNYSLTTHTHSEYASSTHTHASSNLTDVESAGATSGQMLVYAEDDSGYNPVVMSGDATMDKTGAVTVANNSHTHTEANITDLGNYITSAYSDLSANSKIGTGASQVAQGNHTHAYDLSDLGNVDAGESSMDILVYDAGEWTPTSLSEAGLGYGTTASTVCVGNDSRLSNARTPTSHTLASHTNLDFSALDLVSTDVETANDGDYLVFDDTSGKWTAGTPTSASYISSASFNTSTGVITGSGVGSAGFTVDIDGRYLTSISGSSFGDLSNVENGITASSGEVITGDSGEFVSKTLADAGIAAASHTHSYLPLSGGTVNGNVGIGSDASSPLGKLHIASADTGYSPHTGADELVLEGTGDMGMTFLSATGGAGVINFGDSDNNIGFIEYQHGDNSLRLGTNNAERARIDSGGVIQLEDGMIVTKNDGTNTNAYISIGHDASYGQIGAGESGIWAVNNNNMLFGTNNALALTIDTSQNATFSGKIKTGGTSSHNEFDIVTSSATDHSSAVRFGHGSDINWMISSRSQTDGGTNDRLVFYEGTTEVFTLYQDSSATFGGEVRATSDITAYYSDARLKDFHGVIENPLDKVMQLNGYYFTENEKAKELGFDNDRIQVGVSAQEIEEVLPELIKDAPIGHGYKTIDYGKLTPLLIEAIKQQQEHIDNLKKQIGEA